MDPKIFKLKPKKIAHKTGFLASLMQVCEKEVFLFANRSVVIIKNAKVNVASHTTMAVIGRLLLGP